MKKILFVLFFTMSFTVFSQVNDEVSNIILIPHDYTNEQMNVMEEVIETMVKHEGFQDMRRGKMIFTPQGPSKEYKEVIEIHFKSMEYMSDWRDKMEMEIPQERRSILGGALILFYMDTPEK